MAMAPNYKKTGTILFVFAIAMLASGAFFWKEGTAMAPVLLFVGVVDLVISIVMLAKGMRS